MNYLTSYNGGQLEKADALTAYLGQIRSIPMLSTEEEQDLALRLFDEKCVNSGQKLVLAYLKLAAKIAVSFRNYGLPLADLVSEANIGLMHAVRKFDPHKGQKLATYALWWIKAYLYEFVLKSWSLVKIGTATVQKRLFYALKRHKSRLDVFDDRTVKQISQDLNVSEKEVVEMSARLDGDISLNIRIGEDTANERQDMLCDERPTAETILMESDETADRREKFKLALLSLNDREREILTARRLKEEPDTLECLSERYRVSRERIRQIEMRAYEKLCVLVRG